MCEECERLKKFYELDIKRIKEVFEIERKWRDDDYRNESNRKKERTELLFDICDILGIEYGNGYWSVLKHTKDNPILKKLKELNIKEK